MTRSRNRRRYIHVDDHSRTMMLREDSLAGPGAGEVLIAVEAAGVNRADLLQRSGHYPPPKGASPVLGLEVCGEITAVGDGVVRWAPGDRVCALTHGGGYASLAVAPAGQCMPVPSTLSSQEAAALPEALLTTWHNLFQRCRLRAGENVLIHGGASGIGTIAIQVCRALGARVFSTAGTDEKCARLKALGAEHVFNYRTVEFDAALKELGFAGAIHVILDMAGGDFIERNFSVAAPEGRIVNIAFLRGFRAEVNFAQLLMKRLTLTGSTLRAQSFAQKEAMVEEIMASVYSRIEDGSIRPVIDQSFPLEEAGAAHERMKSGDHLGKLVLMP